MAEVEQVDVSTVANWLELGHAVVVDVRESHEYESGHIAESLHIPMSDFDPSLIPTLTEDQHLVFLCAIGQRSQTVANHLLNDGYVDSACNVVGGIQAWSAAGLPVVA